MGQDKHIPAHSRQEDRREGRVEGGGGRTKGEGGRKEGGGRVKEREGEERGGRGMKEEEEWERLGELVSHHTIHSLQHHFHTPIPNFNLASPVFTPPLSPGQPLTHTHTHNISAHLYPEKCLTAGVTDTTPTPCGDIDTVIILTTRKNWHVTIFIHTDGWPYSISLCTTFVSAPRRIHGLRVTWLHSKADR